MPGTPGTVVEAGKDADTSQQPGHWDSQSGSERGTSSKSLKASLTAGQVKLFWDQHSSSTGSCWLPGSAGSAWISCVGDAPPSSLSKQLQRHGIASSKCTLAMDTEAPSSLHEAVHWGNRLTMHSDW